MALCKQCGSANEPGAKFCRKCGESISEVHCPNGYSENASENQCKQYKSGLFANAGAKLKVLALVNFVLIVIVGVVLGIAIIFSGSVEVGLPILIIAPIFGWISSIMLYAFGELCENIRDIAKYTSEINSRDVK